MGRQEDDFVKQLEGDWAGESDLKTAGRNGTAKKKRKRSQARPSSSPFALPAGPEFDRRRRLTVDVEEDLALWFRRFCASKGIKQRDVVEQLLGAFKQHHAA